MLYSFYIFMSFLLLLSFLVFFFKQKTAYEMRISDWSSYVCSSDLQAGRPRNLLRAHGRQQQPKAFFLPRGELLDRHSKTPRCTPRDPALAVCTVQLAHDRSPFISASAPFLAPRRSEEHTSELQSLMRISYAVFCLKKKKTRNRTSNTK